MTGGGEAYGGGAGDARRRITQDRSRHLLMESRCRPSSLGRISARQSSWGDTFFVPARRLILCRLRSRVAAGPKMAAPAYQTRPQRPRLRRTLGPTIFWCHMLGRPSPGVTTGDKGSGAAVQGDGGPRAHFDLGSGVDCAFVLEVSAPLRRLLREGPTTVMVGNGFGQSKLARSTEW